MRNIFSAERRLIEDEHARLERLLQELREVCCEFDSLKGCQNCDRDQFASCQGRLVSFCHDFLDVVIEHFEHEEKIMSEIYGARDFDRFHLHQKDHVRFVREVERLIHELSRLSKQGNAATATRELHGLIEEMFSEHVRSFDDALMHLPIGTQIKDNGDQ